MNDGEIHLSGENLSIVPLTYPPGKAVARKLLFGFWTIYSFPVILKTALKADAIHAPIPGDIGTIGMIIAILLKKPLFVRYCGNWFNQRTLAEKFWKWFMVRFAGGKNIMLATGGSVEPPSMKNTAIQWIFATSLTEKELSELAKRDFPDKFKPNRLIIVCRQEKEKGTSVVIQSLPYLLSIHPEIKLDVVGDGSALNDFKKLSANLNLSDHVIFHGKVGHDRVLQLLRKAHIFCYPSSSEGFPKVVLEAMACGLPVITTKISVLPKLVGTRCGILIDDPIPEKLAQAVEHCLSDVSRYKTLSINAIETSRKYSLEAWRDTLGQKLQNSWGLLRQNG
jgi:glycosyltransferase involved in cell wall biosynthesis